MSGDGENKKEAFHETEDLFYEIEYDSAAPFKGVGKFVLKAQKIDAPLRDEKRILFDKMRDIAREHRSKYNFFSRFYDRGLNDNAVIFYKQGMFMKDFTDDYDGSAQFSQYFPYYQMLGYEQLRTYFTWRAKVREGNILNTSLSYAFMYIYELLNNIGAENPLDGLTKLMSFWKGFSEYSPALDKYMLRWLKDYHVYYELPHSFNEFIEKNDLTMHYPEAIEATDDFKLFCAVSKYDILKSKFYTDNTHTLIKDCFLYVLKQIKADFEKAGMNFDNVFFRPTKKLFLFKPFKGALFYNWLCQIERRVIFSKDEIYICKNNEWFFSSCITSDKGKQFISYVLKKMETELRNITKYKFKLTADINTVHPKTLKILSKAGLHLDKIISASVVRFYKNATKTVVRVDFDSLKRIREEALETQEALIVEDFEPDFSIKGAENFSNNNQIFDDPHETPSDLVLSPWNELKDALSEIELKALELALEGKDISALAIEHKIMPEVLIDSLNEKAVDYLGDNLIGEEFVLYADYIEKVKELIK